MLNKIYLWRPMEAIAKWFGPVAQSPAMHAPVHVGAFAGSYLERRDWDHV